MPRTAPLLSLSLALLALPSSALAQVAAYLDFDAFSDELESVVDASDLAEMRSLGSTLGGRELWLVTVADPDGPPLDERPGVLVVGNLEGDHVVGSQLALEMARYLLAADSGVEALLAEHVFYLVPRLNPDGAEAMFGATLDGRTVNARPFDDDNDGRLDEDPGEDLNGDGLVTLMRVPDARGAYALDEDDARFLVEADPAQRRGPAYALYREGIDSDGDGFLNEDGPGGVDLNRNFQHEYPYYGPDAGPHMVSEIESRALMDFVIGQRNIAAVLTFGRSDNLVTPPGSGGALAEARDLELETQAAVPWDEVFGAGVYPSFSPTGALDLRGVQPGRDNSPESGQRPAVVVDGQDIEYFEAASDAYREATGIERISVHRRPEGAFFQYGYFQFGVPSFSTPGWALPEAPGGEEEESEDAPESVQAQILLALEEGGIDAFVEWTAFEHPELGAVEIGGFRPYAAINPPASELPRARTCPRGLSRGAHGTPAPRATGRPRGREPRWRRVHRVGLRREHRLLPDRAPTGGRRRLRGSGHGPDRSRARRAHHRIGAHVPDSKPGRLRHPRALQLAYSWASRRHRGAAGPLAEERHGRDPGDAGR